MTLISIYSKIKVQTAAFSPDETMIASAGDD
jgi:hypothetical protein